MRLEHLLSGVMTGRWIRDKVFPVSLVLRVLLLNKREKVEAGPKGLSGTLTQSYSSVG